MRALALVAATVVIASCQGGGRSEPDREHFRQPSGLAVSPDGHWLFVSNGNWDQAEAGGTLMALDLDALDQALAQVPGEIGAELDADRPCRRMSTIGSTIECDEATMIDDRTTVRLGSAVGNLAVDLPKGLDGPTRLLTIQRLPPAVAWVDAPVEGGSVRFDCGQDAEGRCDADHLLTHRADDPDRDLPDDPSRIVVDREGFRFAYVPHLTGGGPTDDDRGALSLVALDGDFGPAITDIQGQFFEVSVFEDLELTGGFSVAQRACELETGNAPAATRDCTRPYLYSTHRFWPGVRQFTVAPGLDVVLAGGNHELCHADEPPDSTPPGCDEYSAETVEARPLMGDIEFEDEAGSSLLIVHTTPPTLSRLDTSLDEDDRPRDSLGATTVPLCSNPNLIEVYRAEGEEPLAFVTCFGDDKVAVVALGTFALLATIEVGNGPNEMAIDAGRRRLYVANTRGDTLSVIGLDRQKPGYLRELARIGV